MATKNGKVTMKKMMLTAAFMAALAGPGLTFAQDNAAFEETETIERLDGRIKSNKVFLTAAEKAVAANRTPEAEELLKKAQALSAEALSHYKNRDWAFALEDITESTRMAAYAITLAASRDESLRDVIVREELRRDADKEHESKEARIKKGAVEVEIFIMAAERLLADKENKIADKKLAEAKGLLDASKKAVSVNDYDGAIKLIDEAYARATQSVKEIKKDAGDVITFPKTEFAGEKEALAYEEKKNDRYVFFASQVVKEEDDPTQKLLDDAQSLKTEAVLAKGKNDIGEAIRKYKESTALLIRAIKEAVNR